MRIIIFTVICLLFLASCKKKDSVEDEVYDYNDGPAETTYYYPKPFLQNYFFDVDSYWIYIDTITSEIDTVSVVSKEVLQDGYGSYSLGSTVYYSYKITFYDHSHDSTYYEIIDEYTIKDEYENIILQKSGIDTINSLIINDIEYLNVYKYEISNEMYSATYFYCDSIGIVRKEYQDTTSTRTLDLMNYNTHFFSIEE